MKYTHEYIEGRIIWHTKHYYSLKGRNVKVFKSLKKRDREKFESIIRSANMGIPALLFLGRDKKWTLFGTKKVITGSFLGEMTITERVLRKYKIGQLASCYESFSYAYVTMFYDLVWPIGPVFVDWFSKFKESDQIIVHEKEKLGVLHGPIKSEFECMNHIMRVLVKMYQKEIIPLVGLAAIK